MAKKDEDSIYKVVEVVGTSTKSWADAGRKAVETAAGTLRDLRIAEVVKLDMAIENGKVRAYRALPARSCLNRVSSRMGSQAGSITSAARDRGLRLVALVLPLGEQRELVRCPIGPSGWHGRRVAFVRRKCFEHFVSIVRIGHEGVIVQLYAVRLHVRNIDIAKQWLDITRERNLGHNVLLPKRNAECEIFKQNIKTKLYLLACPSRFALEYFPRQG